MSDKANLPAPAWFNPTRIIAAVLDGKSTESIAAELGTTRERLTYYLATRAPDDWKEAQFLRALRRKESAEDEMDGAQDMLQLNKATAKLRSAQWDLERVCRRIYGDVKEDVPTHTISIHIGINRPGDDPKEPRVIDQEFPSPAENING